MSFTNLNDALNWLYTQKKLKKREDLSRIKKCIELLDLEPNYPIIHLAGTNGKGSTATFIKSILIEDGYKVGFFVSPFVICFNERIQINNSYIADNILLDYINELKKFSDYYMNIYNDVIPFFELTFLIALLHFKTEKVNVGVIECGLGGRLDATNVLKTEISIITNIGYDHMASLGSTLEEISYHKLGITRENQKCFTAVSKDLYTYFSNYANENNVNMIFINDLVTDISVKECTEFRLNGILYKTKMLGAFQAYNASLAILATQAFNQLITYDTIQKGLDNAFWPGRLEVISKEPLIILDGAHNIHGVNALVDSIKVQYKDKMIKTIFTALSDKAYPEMLSKLDEITNLYYFTTISDARATTNDVFIKHTNIDSIYGDYDDIFIKAIKELKDNELLLITGSLHFISFARNTCLDLLKEVKNEK